MPRTKSTEVAVVKPPAAKVESKPTKTSVPVAPTETSKKSTKTASTTKNDTTAVPAENETVNKAQEEKKKKPKQEKQPQQKKDNSMIAHSPKTQDRIAAALAMARSLRPDRVDSLDRLAENVLPKTVFNKVMVEQYGGDVLKKRKLALTDDNAELFSDASIAQAIKKQRLVAAKTVAKNNIKNETKKVSKKGSKQELTSSLRQLSDSDNDSDDDDNTKSSSSMRDGANDDEDKDNYEAESDHDEDGNQLVSLTSALLSLHNVRTEEDTLRDKELGKQADAQYLRQKKVVVGKDKDGKVVKKDLSGKLIEGDDLSRIDRTIFLGNVPNTAKDSDIKAFLGVPIDTIRYRSAGFDTQHLARWIAFAQKRFHEKRDTLVVFVVLKSTDDLQTVLAKNQHVMLDKHIRVDLAGSDGKVDHARSVFVGNLPYDITEEILYDIFEKCGEIESVRAIRDPSTGIGKGFAFVTFVSKTSVADGMKLNGNTPETLGRKLRLTKVSPNAFGKTATFKAELEKQKTVLAKNRQLAQSRSEKLKRAVLDPDDKTKGKKVKVQGSFQKVVGNAGVGHAKKGRHQPRQSTTDQPSWMGARAKPSDTLGRNKAAKKTGGASSGPKKGKK